MTTPTLGRLERVDLREAWKSEASEFTPWLAREENLTLLGEAIGIELQLEGQEQNVGPFRADILCKDTATDAWVLIENQLERTDHTHLGQLLTYAAGLHAVTIVWIAQAFTEEHRAALDWLNEITDERFNFVGLEVELWRIGTSPIAPKFNVVCKPNDWSKTVSEAASRLGAGELSDTQQLQLEFWGALREHLRAQHSFIRATKPLAQNWMTFPVGRTGFWLSAFVNMRDKRVGVELVLSGPLAKPHFRLLQEEKDAIEREVGEGLEWREMPDKKESHVSWRLSAVDPADREQWPRLHAWMRERLELMHRAFARRVKRLNAEEVEAEERAP